MKLPKLFTRKKLRATTARRSLGAPDDMDYEEMSEPNMKLSRALLIVLVLHVVAVAGIIAFNTIKSRQGPSLSTSAARANANNIQTTSTKEEAPATASSDSVASRRDESVPVRPATKVVAKEERKAIPVKPTESSSAKPDSAKTYVVAKGDNPVSIAKKLKVSYAELIAANHIDDPHKLQVGQKLIIPTKSSKPKKASD
jgi:LysM repeat protein